VPDLAQLAGARGGERVRIEEDDDAFVPTEGRQPGALAVLAAPPEVRRLASDLRKAGQAGGWTCGHRRPPRGATNRVAIQSAPAETLFVACKPAVRAASSISLG